MLKIDKDYKSILNCIEGFLLIDIDARLVFMADNLASQVGYKSGAEVIGRHLHEIIPTNNTHKVLKTGERQIGEVYFVAGRTIVSNGFPLYRNNQLIGAFEYDVFEDAILLHGFLDKLVTLSNELQYYKQELKSIRSAKYSIQNIVGSSQKTQELRERIQEAAQSSSTVLIQGETGCGKELVAHSIHKLSTRSFGHFVKINCAAIPPNLFEAEIFGYEEGSFTGAKKGGKKGKAEIANRGTLFLDEVNHLPLYLQAKLLRFLQEKEITRVGGDFAIPVDARIIAATNQNLKDLVASGRFREDFYYRLDVLQINIEPLRNRKEDIPELTETLLADIYESLQHPIDRIPYPDEEVFKLFYSYDWPGNVRELHNILERAANRSPKGPLTIEHFQELFYENKLNDLYKVNKKGNPFSENNLMTLRKIKSEAEKAAVMNTLELCDNNRTKTAEVLGISRQMLHRKIKQYGLGE